MTSGYMPGKDDLGYDQILGALRDALKASPQD